MVQSSTVALLMSVCFLLGVNLPRSDLAVKTTSSLNCPVCKSCPSAAPSAKNCPVVCAPCPVVTTKCIDAPPSVGGANVTVVAPFAIPPLRSRHDLGAMLNALNFEIGVELGVERGLFSKSVLTNWPKCKQYVLVDVWKHETAGGMTKDANDKEQGDAILRDALKNTAQWKDKIQICRDLTTKCADSFDDGHFDFIYVDARRDFKGVEEDLVTWWPKLKPGGVMAGNDYATQRDLGRSPDWTMNFDGTRDATGTVVRGAVDKFFGEGDPTTNRHYRQITVSYRELEQQWPTWAVRK